MAWQGKVVKFLDGQSDCSFYNERPRGHTDNNE